MGEEDNNTVVTTKADLLSTGTFDLYREQVNEWETKNRKKSFDFFLCNFEHRVITLVVHEGE